MTAQELSRPVTKTSEASALWFERLYAALRLPFWVGAFVFAAGGFLAILVAVGLAVGFDLVAQFFSFFPFVTLIALLAQGGGRMARQRIEELNDYAEAMGGGKIDLRPLYSLRNFVVVYVLMLAIIEPLYTFYALPPTIPVEQRFAGTLPFVYWNLFVNALIWVWIYSMYSVRKIGGLPLRLRPFTEDRSLGLKPFGTFSLQLTGLYLTMMALIAIPNAAAGFQSLPLLFFFAGLLLIAPILFLLPLLPLKRKLQRAKRELMAKMGVRYTRAYERIDGNPNGQIAPAVVSELLALGEIRRDVQQIRTWPFDAGVVLRLSAIVISVTAIVLARIVQRLFGI